MTDSITGQRRDRLIRERVHDPYQTRSKPAEPTVCPQCRAVFHKGRWSWAAEPEGAHEMLCPACHRINDHQSAGEVTLGGGFLPGHRDEILQLVRHQEELEKAERPLHRIMAIEDQDGAILVRTTDIHLPRRIGEALHRAYHGELDYHYEKETYFIRVGWRRER